MSEEMITEVTPELFQLKSGQLTLDLTPLAYLIPSVAAEVATGTGFYYSKAKVENRIKLMRQYKVAPQEQHFSDNF